MFNWLKEIREKRERKSYYDLKIWEKGMELTLFIYEITHSFPEEEKFGLVSQMRRAAVSVPSNIAEGYGRFSRKEFCQFLKIAKGSLCELDTQLIISWQLKLISFEKFSELSALMENLHKMLLAFIRKCSQK